MRIVLGVSENSLLSGSASGLPHELFTANIKFKTSSVEDNVRAEDGDLEGPTAIRIVTALVSMTDSREKIFTGLQEMHIEVHCQTIVVLDLKRSLPPKALTIGRIDDAKLARLEWRILHVYTDK